MGKKGRAARRKAHHNKGNKSSGGVKKKETTETRLSQALVDKGWSLVVNKPKPTKSKRAKRGTRRAPGGEGVIVARSPGKGSKKGKTYLIGRDRTRIRMNADDATVATPPS